MKIKVNITLDILIALNVKYYKKSIPETIVKLTLDFCEVMKMVGIINKYGKWEKLSTFLLY